MKRKSTRSGAARTGSNTPVDGEGAPDAGAFLAGRLLVAMPSLAAEPFSRSVIYLCAHTAEGAMGIVVNRPLLRPGFDDLLRQLGIEPLPPLRRIRLRAGGPVEESRGFVLHSPDWTVETSLRGMGQLALTASLDVLKAIAEGGGPRQGMLALGYAGWGPGQLDNELRRNDWLVAPADAALVFDEDDATKWRRALAALNVDPLALSSEVGHA